MIVLAAVAVLVLGAWLAFKPDSTRTTNTPVTGQTTQATASTKGADPSKAVLIEADGFRYEKPAGWAEISSKTLESNGSASGIGRPTEPVATFGVRIADSTPKDSNDLRNGTLSELRKFTNFQLVSDVNTKVDNQSGQIFVYSFSDSEGKNKTTQQMSVIPYKGKTFFLLFSSAAANYDKQTAEFNKILVSFKFK